MSLKLSQRCKDVFKTLKLLRRYLSDILNVKKRRLWDIHDVHKISTTLYKILYSIHFLKQGIERLYNMHNNL